MHNLYIILGDIQLVVIVQTKENNQVGEDMKRAKY